MTRLRWFSIFLALLPIPLLPIFGFARQYAVEVAATAQSEGPPAPTSAMDDRGITLDVVVTDKSGAPVRGLEKQDFTILDDKQPHTPTLFRAVDAAAGTPDPVGIVLVVDTVNADVLKTGREREGIKTFLQANGGKLAQPVSLVFISDKGAQIQNGSSTDGNALAVLLDQYETSLRSTEYSSDRFPISIGALNSLTAYEAAKPGRKLVIWISPGWPLISGSESKLSVKDHQQIFNSVVAASTQMRRAGITVYNVQTLGIGADLSQLSYYQQFLKGVKLPRQTVQANLALQVLAVQTGGLVLSGSNDLPDEIAKEIAQSASDASAFYVLSFQAPKADRPNEYHTLEVKVAKPGLTARTRTGYYAQP